MSAVTYTSGFLAGVCFCGRTVALTAIDQEAAIYCSTECARKDAMAALVAPSEEEEEVMETLTSDRPMSPRKTSRRSTSASRYSARVSALLRSFDLEEQHYQHHQQQQQKGSHYRNRMKSLYTQDAITGRQLRNCNNNMNAINRCSIFQDLAGEYSVDDGGDEMEWMRDLSGRNSVDFRLSCTPSEMLNFRISTKKSEDSLAESFLGLDAMAASPSLSYEDPVGWGEGAPRVQSTDYSDLFPSAAAAATANRRSRQLLVSPTPTEVTSKVFRSTKKNASEAGGALVTVHLPNQAKRRQSRDLLCASLNAAPTRANTISRRHSRAPSTTTSTFRSIISLPSKTCSALFNRSSKSSFHSLGISNRDEPCLYAVVL